MANTFFKSFAENDRTSTRTLLHENIPITGTIVSGTYTNADKTAQKNIKSFFPKDSKETETAVFECWKNIGPNFISLKSDKQIGKNW